MAEPYEIVVRCPHPCNRFVFGVPSDMPVLKVPIRRKCDGCKRMVLWWPNRMAVQDVPALPSR